MPKGKGEEEEAMMGKKIDARLRLKIIAVVTLVTGLASSVTIYLRAEDAADNLSLYELEYSKKYLRDLEQIGGKANVLASEFTSWFAGLWHGKTLAYTVASLTILAALVLLLIARHLPPDQETTGNGEEKGGDGKP